METSGSAPTAPRPLLRPDVSEGDVDECKARSGAVASRTLAINAAGSGGQAPLVPELGCVLSPGLIARDQIPCSVQAATEWYEAWHDGWVMRNFRPDVKCRGGIEDGETIPSVAGWADPGWSASEHRASPSRRARGAGPRPSAGTPTARPTSMRTRRCTFAPTAYSLRVKACVARRLAFVGVIAILEAS